MLPDEINETKKSPVFFSFTLQSKDTYIEVYRANFLTMESKAYFRPVKASSVLKG